MLLDHRINLNTNIDALSIRDEGKASGIINRIFIIGIVSVDVKVQLALHVSKGLTGFHPRLTSMAVIVNNYLTSLRIPFRAHLFPCSHLTYSLLMAVFEVMFSSLILYHPNPHISPSYSPLISWIN